MALWQSHCAVPGGGRAGSRCSRTGPDSGGRSGTRARGWWWSNPPSWAAGRRARHLCGPDLRPGGASRGRAARAAPRV